MWASLTASHMLRKLATTSGSDHVSGFWVRYCWKEATRVGSGGGAVSDKRKTKEAEEGVRHTGGEPEGHTGRDFPATESEQSSSRSVFIIRLPSDQESHKGKGHMKERKQGVLGRHGQPIHLTQVDQ